MPKVVLKLLTTARGQVTEFDNSYLQSYDASYHLPGGEYDGGLLEVTQDINQAMRFENAAAALAKWHEAYGIREDGEPNRPLTAWTVEILPIEEAIHEKERPA